MRSTAFVTDRTNPVVCVTTQIARADYDALNKIAALRHTTKAALLRELVVELVNRPRDPIQDDRAAWPT